MKKQTLHHFGGYHFFPLDNPKQLQTQLTELLAGGEVLGTFLLAKEGINFGVTGPAENLARLKSFVSGFIPPGQEMVMHEWPIASHGYKKLLIKVKKEIVTMKDPGSILPHRRAEYLSPQALRDMLARGEDIFLLDTRNQFEFEAGHFIGAHCLGNESFGDFAKMAKDLPEELKKKKVVMYCTGGIRCEKASHLFLEQLGFSDVWQLHGGILNYFKQCGHDFFPGECFVFDHRRTVNPSQKDVNQ